MRTTEEILRAAKAALPALLADRNRKTAALYSAADRLILEQEAILQANAEDVEAAKEHLSNVMIDRLRLDPARICAMADGIRAVAALPDPEGQLLSREVRPNGLVIDKVSCALGVIAVIYESRPNVTSDAAVLALKAGNAVVLRGGREAFCSNRAVVQALRRGIGVQKWQTSYFIQ